MISVDEARALILAAINPCPAKQVSYEDALGLTLATDVLAERTQPPFPASAMDGYAVLSEDLGDEPARLVLAGESAAGHAHDGPMTAGTAMRISTGAPIPAGATQVVIQENTERDGDHLILRDTPRPGSNIRVAGTDFSTGDTLLPAGLRISGEAIGLAISGGLTEFSVRRPRIGIISTGDELVEPGETTGPSQIINSVSRGIAGLVRDAGCEPVYLGIARDDRQSVRDKLASGAGLDLVVTIGGASVGDHDHLRSVFHAEGGGLVFEKIAVKPGKPTWFGKLHGTHFLGLPGNPVSALVIARLFLNPALAQLAGRSEIPDFLTASTSVDIPANGRRETYIRAMLDSALGSAAPLDNQDSSALSALVRANALIRRLADAPAVQAGAEIEVLPLPR
jgi:molybdopterin molybdotransferase